MRAVRELPKGYREIDSVNLKTDKKAFLIVNLLALVIAALMFVPMHFYVPVSALFDMKGGLPGYVIRFVSFIVLLILYIVLHELVHGVAMKICGTRKVKYGFTGMYAYAGSDDYYGKAAYIFIALAPVVLWGAVLAIVNPFVSREWFWVVYILQITNISGAAGDLYVTRRFLHFPKDILVKDCGVGMTVYSRK